MNEPRILIVEDEPIVAADLSAHLKRLHYQTVGRAASGAQAIALAGELRPDLVLMDIRLEGDMDGVDAAVAIRQRFRIPSLFISAFSEQATIDRAKVAEPFGYILKPFDSQELRANIEIALHKHLAEEALRLSEVRLQEILDHLDGLVYVTDMQTYQTLFVNKYGKQVWGDFTGKTCWQNLQSGQTGPCSHCTNSRLLHPDGTPTGVYVWEFQNAVTKRYYECRDSAIRWPDGRMVRLEIATDITDRKQIEAQNRQLLKAESLGRMAGAIAHNFNNQLAAVMMNLELLQQDLPLQAGARLQLSEALQSARKAADISTQMLVYLGQTTVHREPLDLSEACRLCLPLLQEAKSRIAVLKADLPAPGPVINSNANQIQQVLTNLLTNAWEASRAGSDAIRLTVKQVSTTAIPVVNRFPIDWQPQAPAYACLEVADSGGGIPAGDIEKLFDPFFTSKFIGKGLGLSVVLGILRGHDGGITVESEPGLGSVFRVFLPLTAATVPPKAVAVVPAPKMAGCGVVLVVEDELALRAAVTRALQRAGYKVITAKDGVEGVELFERHRNEINCVLCDLTMPRMGGWETLTALRKLAPGLPVILSSGYDEASVMEGHHPELPQAYLRKPYELKVLFNTISQFQTVGLNDEG
jgi:signal transduction histidine kinase/DNA-binding response OmpR family regulator